MVRFVRTNSPEFKAARAAMSPKSKVVANAVVLAISIAAFGIAHRFFTK
jgi:hypothetical protein